MATQSNTHPGDISLPANSDLTGKSGYLVRIVNNAGVPSLDLPASKDDVADYVLLTENTAGLLVYARPLTTENNYRVFLKGTGNPGDEASLADPTTSADAGKVLVSTDPLDGPLIVKLQEVGVDGQQVLVRPLPGRNRKRKFVKAVLVGGTVTVADVTVTAKTQFLVTRIVTGGTEGHLTVGTVTAGTSYVLNSSSGSDTSTLLIEVIN